VGVPDFVPVPIPQRPDQAAHDPLHSAGKKNPADLANKNNLAVTALLLNATELKPHDLAREVYQKSNTNASFASTYAFSLYTPEEEPGSPAGHRKA
jgi:hypothetical protein